MISVINGKIISITDAHLVINVGPMGLTISTPNPALFTTGQTVTLHTHLHWHQEQGPTLFGFATEIEKTIFLLLIDCPGIGPKIGLAVNAHLSPQEFFDAIQQGNDKSLSKISGIGAKKAEQIIVHLKHKVQKLIENGLSITLSETTNHWKTVSDALTALNYSRMEISHAIKHVQEQTTEHAQTYTFDHLLRRTLVFLAKK